KTTTKKRVTQGVLFVSATGSKPPGISSVGALPARPVDSPKVYEENVRKALETATGLTATTGELPSAYQEGLLLSQPRVGTEPGLTKIPDYLLMQKQQIEVFEVTLDSDFRLGRPSTESGVSHKRLQFAGSVDQLSQQYPGVPIVYNIRVPKEAPDKI